MLRALMYSLLLSLTLGCEHKSQSPIQKISDPTIFVDPFIGTGGHGHTFPGPSRPFGMVQLGPDSRLTGWDGCSAYHFTDTIVYGFSHTHLSGTGVSDYGDILIMPGSEKIHLANGADGETGYSSAFAKSSESASPGYYTCFLNRHKIKVELSTTERAGIHRYQFSQENNHIILDLNHRDKVLDAGIEFESATSVQGYRISKQWADEQHVYFYIESSVPFNLDAVEWSDDNNVVGIPFTKNQKNVILKVGISAVSVSNAKANLRKEIEGFDFEKIKNDSKKAWKNALSKIEVHSNDTSRLTNFYTALYHTMIAPNLYSDVDGRYRGMDHKIHKVEAADQHYTVFSLWDTYRATHPLYTLIEEKRTNAFIRTMLRNYQDGGILPIWELAGNYTGCMIGYHAIPVIADAYGKGIRGFDEKLAIEAMIHSASQKQLGLDAYQTKGFIASNDESESVSKTLEYGFDDWCIADMAASLGNKKIHERFIKRSQAYTHLYDPKSGFIRGRRNGGWIEPFDPTEVNFNFTEANCWQYNFYVPHDIEGMIEIMGGSHLFEEKLDGLFSASSKTTGRQQADITGLIGQYAHGNEPSHHMAYLYNYIGKPYKTQELTRKIIDDLYHASPDGLCGNEDCGQMSAWYVLSALGIYPVNPANGIYDLTAPLFPKVVLHFETGDALTIEAEGADSHDMKYIQAVSLNEQPYDKNYITHHNLRKGGRLLFDLGARAQKTWGSDSKAIYQSGIKNRIVPVPHRLSSNSAFTDSIEVRLAHAYDYPIFYKWNKKEFVKYTDPILLDTTGTLIFYAGNNGLKSNNVMAEFFKIPEKRKVQLATSYANQYSAGGDQALIDFLRGNEDFRVGSWQGYEGVDLEAIIDLGEAKMINKLGLSCLQDQRSWIFMPVKVTYWISDDGKEWTEMRSLKNPIEPASEGGILHSFEFKPKASARFVKVKAENRKVVPEWHLGAGGKSWIFVDEIIIE